MCMPQYTSKWNATFKSLRWVAPIASQSHKLGELYLIIRSLNWTQLSILAKKKNDFGFLGVSIDLTKLCINSASLAELCCLVRTSRFGLAHGLGLQLTCSNLQGLKSRLHAQITLSHIQNFSFSDSREMWFSSLKTSFLSRKKIMRQEVVTYFWSVLYIISLVNKKNQSQYLETLCRMWWQMLVTRFLVDDGTRWNK